MVKCVKLEAIKEACEDVDDDDNGDEQELQADQISAGNQDI